MARRKWIVKAFHTGGPYQKDADKLQASCEKFNIPLDIEVIQSQGSWNDNTHFKPRSILNGLLKYPDKDIWHIDIDTWFMQYPALFDEKHDYDIAAFYWETHRKWCSGTIYCNNVSRVMNLLYDWRAELIARPKVHGDQLVLGELLDKWNKTRDPNLRIGKLPPGYIQGRAEGLKEGEGVIAHDGARKRYVGTKIFTEPK